MITKTLHQLRTLLLLAVVALVATACGDKGVGSLPVPAKASFVAVVNLKGMGEKLKYEDLKKEKSFQEWEKEVSQDKKAQHMLDVMKKVMKDPKGSGIDFDRNLYAFNVLEGEGQTYMGVAWGVRDEDDFKKLMEDASQGKLKLNEKNGYQVGKLPDGILVFNGKKALVLVGNTAEAEDNAEKQALAYMEMKDDDNMAQNEDFVTFEEKVKDLGMYATLKTITDVMGSTPAQLKGLGLEEKDLTDNKLSLLVNFDNGELVADLSYSMKGGFMSSMKPLAGPNVGEEALKNISSEQLAGFMVMSLNINNVFFDMDAMAKKFPQFGMLTMGLNEALKEYGLTKEILDKILTGQMLVAVTDVKVTAPEVASTDDDYRPSPKVEPTVVSALGVKDKDQLQKLLADAWKEKLKEEKGVFIYDAGGRDVSKIYYTYKGKFLYASNEAEPIENIASGSVKTSPHLTAEAKKVANAPLGYYMNLNPKRMSANLLGYGEVGEVAKKAGLDYVVLDNTGSTLKFRMKFADSSVNSLVGLIRLAAATN